MPSDPTGDVVRNLIRLRRLANGLSEDVRTQVRALVDDFVGEMARTDPTAVTRSRYRQERIDKLLARLREIAAEHYPDIRKGLEAALARVGVQQSQWAARTLDASVGKVGAVDVSLRGVGLDWFRSVMRAEPFHGELMREWFGRHEARTLERARQQIRLGLAQDEPIGDLIRRIRGRSVGGGRFTGGVLEVSTREAEAIARTATTFIANRAHLEAYQANADVITGVQFTATLDSRTTPICARWDGTVWAQDDPRKQVPPLHPNCRSVLVPVIDWKGLGLGAPSEGTRASAGGQVAASTTYEDWFRRQPKREQDRVIGPQRAELFRQGKINFRDMIGRDNRVLRIDELEAA